MTLREAYEYGQKQLNEANIEDADLDAWYLLEFVTMSYLCTSKI